jgi:hypothetical protein
MAGDIQIPNYSGDPLDKEDPRSLYNRLTNNLKEKLDALDPTIWDLSQEDLWLKAQPSHAEAMTRQALWKTFYVAKEDTLGAATHIPIAQITKNMDRANFYRVIANPHKLAWMFTPPKNYMDSMEECLDLGLNRLREILGTPIKDKNGKIDPKAASVVLKAIALVDIRLKGAPVQRNVNLNLNKEQTQALTDMGMIDQRLAELEGDGQKLLEKKQAPQTVFPFLGEDNDDNVEEAILVNGDTTKY